MPCVRVQLKGTAWKSAAPPARPSISYHTSAVQAEYSIAEKARANGLGSGCGGDAQQASEASRHDQCTLAHS